MDRPAHPRVVTTVDPVATMGRWSPLGRWWGRRLAQDLVDITLLLGILPPTRKARVVLLRDATEPARYLRAPVHTGDEFNTSAWRLVSSSLTRRDELGELSRRGWRLEYWAGDFVRHPSFERWMLVPVVLRHVVEWGCVPSRDVVEETLPEGSRERSVLAHVTAHLQRTRVPVGERRAAGNEAIDVALLLLTLPEPEWEVYAQLAADHPWPERTSPWEQVRTLAEAARLVLT